MRVVTWNIHHGAPARGPVDLDAVAGVLRPLAPDVVVLQEVDRHVGRSGGVDQAAELGAALGMAGHFAGAMRWPPNPLSPEPVAGAGAYGIAVLAPPGTPAPEVLRLPHSRAREPRVATLVRVPAGRGAVTVVGTHLQNGPRLEPRPTEAMRQLRWLAEHLEAVGEPVVLAGDVNMHRRVAARVLEPFGWSLAITAPTFPASRPARTIDVAAVRGAVVSEARVPATVVSDHRPIVADLAPPGHRPG